LLTATDLLPNNSGNSPARSAAFYATGSSPDTDFLETPRLDTRNSFYDNLDLSQFNKQDRVSVTSARADAGQPRCINALRHRPGTIPRFPNHSGIPGGA